MNVPAAASCSTEPCSGTSDISCTPCTNTRRSTTHTAHIKASPTPGHSHHYPDRSPNMTNSPNYASIAVTVSAASCTSTNTPPDQPGRDSRQGQRPGHTVPSHGPAQAAQTNRDARNPPRLATDRSRRRAHAAQVTVICDHRNPTASRSRDIAGHRRPGHAAHLWPRRTHDTAAAPRPSGALLESPYSQGWATLPLGGVVSAHSQLYHCMLDGDRRYGPCQRRPGGPLSASIGVRPARQPGTSDASMVSAWSRQARHPALAIPGSNTVPAQVSLGSDAPLDHARRPSGTQVVKEMKGNILDERRFALAGVHERQ